MQAPEAPDDEDAHRDLAARRDCPLAPRRIFRERRLQARHRWGVPGDGNGQFGNPHGIAASPANGDVYVVDFGNHRVQEFTQSGRFVKK